MDSSQSSVKYYPKPINIFYIWYSELCRRMNCTPARVVKPAKPRSQTILDFVGDRLKVEEWNPIVNALRNDRSLHVISIKSRICNCPFLHDIDTEEKARHMKRRFGSLWTAYILRQLTKSISTSLRNTEVLTLLELDGLPMFSQYLEPLLQALKKNKTVKHLSFANCSIQDAGCELVCGYLRYAPNIEVINLSGCGLSSVSGEHLAKLVKYQQINRYCESWHNSLRYENPQKNSMRGIKRITINCNTEFADKGFENILNELEDDLWIKALDLQRCGITENLACKIIDVVQYNRSLEIVDLRQNDLLDIKTLEKVLQLLRDKQEIGYQPEFQWCNTALSLNLDPLSESSSKFSVATPVHKIKSAPGKTNCSRSSAINLDINLRKSKTADNVSKNANISIITNLNLKLQAEIQKRKMIEKKHEELKLQLEEIHSSLKNQSQHPNGVKKQLKVILDPINKKPSKPVTKFKEKQVHTEKNGVVPTEMSKKNGLIIKKNGFKPIVVKNGFNNIIPNCSNGVTNGHSNGFSSRILNSACKIFENLLKNDTLVDTNNDCEDLLHYLNGDRVVQQETENLSDLSSESQSSLYKFINELKNDNTDKYLIKGNQNTT